MRLSEDDVVVMQVKVEWGKEDAKTRRRRQGGGGRTRHLQEPRSLHAEYGSTHLDVV